MRIVKDRRGRRVIEWRLLATWLGWRILASIGLFAPWLAQRQDMIVNDGQRELGLAVS